MRKITLLMHVSLDGYVAGPKGEMDWIKLSDEMWDYVKGISDSADTVIFGEKTFRMMEAYWPAAAEQAGASKHDIDHSRWINGALKIVFSKNIQKSDWKNTRIVKGDLLEEMTKLKDEPGMDILMIGSPTLAKSFMAEGLIDEFRLNINPIVLGEGMPLFADGQKIDLDCAGAQPFKNGVVGLTYRLEK